jgi:2-dehydropantoate 2-reductase
MPGGMGRQTGHMRFVIYGAGAVGGVIGGRMFEAGHEVVLIARGEHCAAIRRDGLQLDSPDGTSRLAIDAVDHPGQVDWREDDVVLLTVKSQDTGDALDALAAHAPESTTVVCAQNGVDNERRALRKFERVYAICVMCPTAHLRPGVVQAHSTPITGILDVGRYPSGVDECALSIAAALEAATFLSEPRDDIMRWKYRKLITNLGNAVQALCVRGQRGTPRQGETLARLVREEAVECVAKAGIDVVSEEDDTARRANHLQIGVIGGQHRSGGSSWQSLERATGTIETDYLNGEIVLLGRSLGVPVPANALVQRRANELARTRQPPGSVSEAALLAELGLG